MRKPSKSRALSSNVNWQPASTSLPGSSPSIGGKERSKKRRSFCSLSRLQNQLLCTFKRRFGNYTPTIYPNASFFPSWPEVICIWSGSAVPCADFDRNSASITFRIGNRHHEFEICTMFMDCGLQFVNQFLNFLVVMRREELGTQITDSIFSSHQNVPAKA